MAAYPNIATCSPETDADFNPIPGELGMQLEDAYLQGVTHRVAMVVAFNAIGQVLLQRRGRQVLWPNTWDTSAAGHVDAGKTYLECAVAEAEEEVGITVGPSQLQRIAHFKLDEPLDPGEAAKFKDIKSVSRWNALFAYVLPEGEDFAINDSGEVESAKWADMDDVRKDIAQQPRSFRPGALHAFRRLFDATDSGLFVPLAVTQD